MTSKSRRRRASSRLLAMSLVASALVLIAISATAAAAGTRHARFTPIASAARTVPRSLVAAARNGVHADRVLVADAKVLKRCLQEHSKAHRRCASPSRAVQRAGVRFAQAQRRLAQIARASRRSRRSALAASALRAPQMRVSGDRLLWRRVARVNTYVLRSRVPGQPAQYSILSGTSTTPPPVPGVVVRYSVRTTVGGSAWATEQAITYPSPSGTLDAQAAPAISVSGNTLTWDAIANVSTYVLATKAPGAPEQYSVVSGTTVTPPSLPGTTVRYKVRAAVVGSAWSSEVSISYPRAATPSVAPTPASSPTASNSFEMGVVPASSASSEPTLIRQLGANQVRMEFEIGAPASQLAPAIEAYARSGIRILLLAGFSGTLPSPAQAQNLASWAAAYGPGGSFWQGKSLPASAAVTSIEFGNETSYTYQFSDNSTAALTSRAETYALRFKEGAEAIRSSNPGVGLLAQADNGGNGAATWVNGMFAAVPNLLQFVAGWTVHPYGPEWQIRIDQLLSETRALGDSSVPIYVTEWGLATDNGRCLSDNYGWNPCMSYDEAATTLGSTLGAMRARYGTRLRAFYLYQAQDQGASGASTNREEYFGALQSTNARKGAYTTEVESLLSASS